MIVNISDPHSNPVKPLAESPELASIYRGAPIGLAFLSTDCRYVMINQRLTEICGVSIEDHIGRSVRDTVPQVADQVEQIVQAILRTGEPITGIEVNGQRPDGSNVDRVWITYWHPLKNGAGDVVGINVAAEEITERKRAEVDLAASQDQLRRLNETLAERVEAQAQERDRIWKLSQDLLIVTDSNGIVVNVNPAWSVTLGWSADDLVGKSGQWLVHPDDRERSMAELGNLVAGLRTRQLENRIIGKDGSYRWLSWSAVPDRGFIYATARDITDLKNAQEQLETLRHQLADASRQTTMGAMTASIAHEINQPLTAIMTNASAGSRWLTRANPNLAEAQAAFDQIEKGCHRMNEVIASVRAMFGRGSSKSSVVDLRQLVDEVLALTQGELATLQITLRNNMNSELPAVLAERVPIQQVVLNLVMNAIEAMSSVVGRERRLTVGSGFEKQASVTITVEDTGSGIDPVHLQRIFDPFFTTKPKGMGLDVNRKSARRQPDGSATSSLRDCSCRDGKILFLSGRFGRIDFWLTRTNPR
jgi:PAS domain S-box-containing protein